jgi:hypothetical protein
MTIAQRLEIIYALALKPEITYSDKVEIMAHAAFGLDELQKDNQDKTDYFTTEQMEIMGVE